MIVGKQCQHTFENNTHIRRSFFTHFYSIYLLQIAVVLTYLWVIPASSPRNDGCYCFWNLEVSTQTGTKTSDSRNLELMQERVYMFSLLCSRVFAIVRAFLLSRYRFAESKRCW